MRRYKKLLEKINQSLYEKINEESLQNKIRNKSLFEKIDEESLYEKIVEKVPVGILGVIKMIWQRKILILFSIRKDIERFCSKFLYMYKF